ncbi:MAG TPA: RDD family protein [Blastocatellia bacterium]|nr:RDD family protein [Blastocatellia bacterium]
MCSHNNAMLRVSAWRSRRSGNLKEATPRRTSEISTVPKAEPIAQPEPAYLRFPTPAPAAPKAAPTVQPVLETAATLAGYPPWRAEVKEKVRQAREKRLSQSRSLDDQHDETELDPNPIVAAALKRIRKTSTASVTPPAITTPTRTVRNGSRASALAEKIDALLTPELKPEPPAEPLETPPVKLPPNRPAVPRSVRPAISALAAKPAPGRVETKPFTPRPSVELPVKPEPKVQPEVRVRPEPKIQPESRVRPELEARVRPEPKVQPEVRVKPEPRIQSELRAESRVRPELEARVRPEPKVQPEVRVRPEPKIQPESEPLELSPVEIKHPNPIHLAPPATVETREIEPEYEHEYEEAKSGPLPIVQASNKRIDTQIIEIPLIISELQAAGPKPPTLWVRTLAGGCDFEIIAMSFLPVFAAYATLNTSLGEESFFILFVLLAAITFAYQTITLSIAGRTFGMAVLNLKLVDAKDESLPITYRQKLLRAWGATVAFILPPLNLLVMRLNGQGYSLPDLVSGTLPIEE